MIRLLLLALIFQFLFGIAGSQERTDPLEKFIGYDGKLAIPREFSGVIDPKGWRLKMGPRGEPRFVPDGMVAAAVPEDAAWDDRFEQRGITGSIFVMAAMGTDLYIGGNFIAAGSSGARYIAKWDGSGWSSLGSGVDNVVEALTVVGTDLYVGGLFTTAGGVTVNHVAKWDGHNWSSLGLGTNEHSVSALSTAGSDIYAGGDFTEAGGVSANRIAKWNGTNWSALGNGCNSNVLAIAAIGTSIYAGGYFDSAGTVLVKSIAQWDGSNWSALGSGTDGYVNALAVIGSDLYVGGFFSSAGAVSAKSVAKWDGSNWSALGLGIEGIFPTVQAFAVSGSDLFVGGSFSKIGALTVNNIAKWNGSWSALGSGTSGTVAGLAIIGSNVFVGGFFDLAGGTHASNMAFWNGSSWSPVFDALSGLGLSHQVFATVSNAGDLYVGGSFLRAGGAVVNYIAKWDGHGWSSLGGGVNGDVMALAMIGSDLYAGGYFDSAGGAPANHIAKWNGSTWSGVGSGTDRTVFALGVIGTTLYAGGSFTHAGGSSAYCIAKWNGSTWSPLGMGTSGDVSAIAVIGSDLYVGGNFYSAGGVTVVHDIAKWDGSSWSSLGSGMSGGTSTVVSALATRGTELYAGGNFTSVDGVSANNIAKWDGSSWTALGSGMGGALPSVTTIAFSGEDLYVGGRFTSAGGMPANHVAKWDGVNWSTLGSGTDREVYTIAPMGTDLYVGGFFGLAGNNVASCFSRWKIADSPTWSWAKSVSGSSSEIATGVVTDDSGNVYITGYFGPTSANFGSGPIPSAGDVDIFLAKYDPNGNLMWVKTAGGTSEETPSGIAVDHDGNIFLTGSFLSTSMLFDTMSVSKPGIDYDLFIAKYDRNGHALWARAAGGNDWDFSNSVAVDGNGNAIITGQFLSGSLQFGSTSALINSGGFAFDMFLAKYSPTGTALWSRKDGSTGNEAANGVTADATGNIYCTGSYTSSSLAFGATPALSNHGQEDFFVVKYDTGGTPIWSRSSTTGSTLDEGRSISVDGNGNVYVSGKFNSPSITIGSATFLNMNPTGAFSDIFIVKYSNSGNFIWAHQAGGPDNEAAHSSTTDASGNCYVVGSYEGRSFSIGKFSFSNPFRPQSDLFVGKYDSSGTSLWALNAGSTYWETANGVAVDGAGNALVAGYFVSSSVKFGAYTVVNGGSNSSDVLIAKVGLIQPTVNMRTTLRSGWNLLSLPVIPPNDSVKVCYPGSSSNAFVYSSSHYTPAQTVNHGNGFWLKFPSTGASSVSGFVVSYDTIVVAPGWNLIGSISTPIAASSITSVPPGLVTSKFFSYGGSYAASDSMIPGKGYWVKVSGSGKLILSPPGTMIPEGTIRIVATSELPPFPPEDANVIKPSTGIPDEFTLEQNYPNPFNPVTNIAYGIPDIDNGKIVKVQLKIYDILGQEVVTLVDELQEPGMKSVKWDASRVATGVYYYRLNAGEHTFSKKLLLVK